MSFNFPDSPTDGQIFEPILGLSYIFQTPVWKRYIAPGEDAGVPEAPADGLTYGRKDTQWAAVVGGALVSDGPPPGPLQSGQMWYEADSGNTFLWYDDGDSQQWVQINIQPAIATNPLAGLTAETRNRVVNPCFQISQENGNTAITTGLLAADQWIFGNTTAATATLQRVQVVTPNGSKDRLRLSVTVADTSMAASDLLYIYTPIEGIRMTGFGYGSASAKQSVLRFGWKSPAGTYSLGLQGTGTRTFIANWTISAGQANTDTVQTIVIPGDVTGTWATGAVAGSFLDWCVAAGTTYHGVAGWQAGGQIATASNTNGAATAGNTFELFDVGWYLDPLSTGLPPAWIAPDETEELRACQRYYRPFPEFMGSLVTTTIFRTIFTLEPPMRIAPAVTMAATTVHIWHSANQNMTGAPTVSTSPTKVDWYIGITPAWSVNIWPCSITYSTSNKLNARM